MADWTSVIPPLPLEEWQQVLAEHHVAVLVLCCAQWSQPDHAMFSVLRKVRPEYKSIAFFCVDISEDGADLAKVFEEYTTPTLICFFNGQEHAKSVGYMMAEPLRAQLREWLASST